MKFETFEELMIDFFEIFNKINQKDLEEKPN